MFGEEGQVALVLPVLVDIVECDDGCAEEVLNWFAELLALDELVDLPFERTILLLHLLLLIDVLLFIFLTLF